MKEKGLVLRIRCVPRGGHVHMRVFAGLVPLESMCNSQNFTLGKSGELVLRDDEFEKFREGAAKVDFLIDGEVTK